MKILPIEEKTSKSMIIANNHFRYLLLKSLTRKQIEILKMIEDGSMVCTSRHMPEYHEKPKTIKRKSYYVKNGRGKRI